MMKKMNVKLSPVSFIKYYETIEESQSGTNNPVETSQVGPGQQQQSSTQQIRVEATKPEAHLSPPKRKRPTITKPTSNSQASPMKVKGIMHQNKTQQGLERNTKPKPRTRFMSHHQMSGTQMMNDSK